MPMPRRLFLLFAIPFCLLLGVALAPRFTTPALSDGEIPHVSRSDPLLTTHALRDTQQDPLLRAYHAPTNRELLEEENPVLDEDGIAHASAIDGTSYPLAMPVPAVAFNGMFLPPDSNTTPPDTTGEMGRDMYVQAVNSRLQVFDRSGTSLLGPIDLGTVWAELGEPCSRSHGDPNVLYDQFAGRWLITQPVFSSQGAFGVCMALSVSEDALGEYALYYFPLEETYIYDYPMFSVWHDSYYMTANRLTRSWGPAGAAFVAFERDAMLAGTSAQALVFPFSATFKAVVADADGDTLPNTAAVFFAMRSSTNMRVWRLFPNWQVPPHSNLIVLDDMVVAEHDTVCQGCVAQPDTTRLLGSHTNGLAHEASYRDFGTHDSVILTHATSTPGEGSADQVGVRWYEIRGIQSGMFEVHQQSTYAPDDGIGRWMPAAALDRFGNLLVQYTVASPTLYPGIRYSGRLATDPLGTLAQGEMTLATGGGSQTGSSRWGDYTTIALDPLDDCTFWFANQVVPETRASSWATVIAAVRYPGCVPPVTPTPAPSFTPTATETPLPPPTGTAQPTYTPEPTVTILAPETPVPTASATPTAMPSVTPSETALPSPTGIPSPTVSATHTPSGDTRSLYLPLTQG